MRLALRTRIPALKERSIIYDPLRPSEEFHAQLPASVRWKADNYDNLLEQPTIFYAAALTLTFLNAGSGLNAGLPGPICCYLRHVCCETFSPKALFA